MAKTAKTTKKGAKVSGSKRKRDDEVLTPDITERTSAETRRDDTEGHVEGEAGTLNTSGTEVIKSNVISSDHAEL